MPTDSIQLVHWLTITLLGLPFLGLVILSQTSRQLAAPVAIALTWIGLVISIWLVVRLPTQAIILQGNWALLSGMVFPVSLRIDGLAALMLVLVHFIALLVQIYSVSYLRDEPKLARYFAYLQLFVGAMLGIVLAGNLLLMYMAWELVGLASYLLIGFYAERVSASRAAKKAFLMNRVGDIGFLIGIFWTYYVFGTLDFSVLAVTNTRMLAPTGLGLCLFMGCVGKSAQFPLLTWLPDAMEGPTPVSALLHAATMVAAGIFLLARIHPLLSPDALVVVALVGTITAILGGYFALFQTDIKKVLAFSTVSQLGLMVAAMGTGNISGAMFHLFTHAFFKAGLFLSAGAVIHAVHTQDMRSMGGLRNRLPVTFVAYTLCAAALAGVPLLSGFLSKEVILSGAFSWASAQNNPLAYLIPSLLLLSSALTALYMARQWRLVFFGSDRNEMISLAEAHEPDWLMRLPVLLLAILSIGFWFSLNPFAAHGSWFFEILPAAKESVFSWLGPLSVGLVLLSGWLGFRMTEPRSDSIFVQFSLEYGFLDLVYQYLVINPMVKLALLLSRIDQRVVDGLINGFGIATVVIAQLTRVFDRLGIDGLVNGVAWLASWLGQLTRSIQNGRAQSYITAAVVGLLLVLWWIL